MKSMFLSFATLVAFVSCVSCIPTRVVVAPSFAEVQVERSSAVLVAVHMLLDGRGHEHELSDPQPGVMTFGSGAVIGVKDGRSLIVTAGHVCDHSRASVRSKDGTRDIELPVLKTLFMVKTVAGTELIAVPAHSDSSLDLCVMVVGGVAGSVAKIGDVEPPIGAPVIYIGAPGGNWNSPAVPIIDGRFSGTDSENTVLSMPIIPGSSGSGVFYDGSLFSVVIKHSADFDNLWYGTLPHQTFLFMKTAQDAFYGR